MTVTDGAARSLVERPAGAATRSSAEVIEAAPLTVFTADQGVSGTALETSAAAGFLAELVAHKAAETPLCIGLLGPAGSGKSTLLDALMAQVARLSHGAERSSTAPFLMRIATARIAVAPGLTAAGIMRTVADALAPDFPRLIADADQAGLDPQAAAREAGERLAAVRQQLDAERRSLDELSSRHARITDTVLFDTAGSRVDAYARANRGRIERSFRRFGFTGDTILAYKDLVRDASEQGGASQALSWLRAIWAYRGQTRLIVTAAVLFLVAWGIGLLIDNQESLLQSLRTSSEQMVSTASWLQAHVGWLSPVKTAAVLGGLLALLVNGLRAFRFLQPISRGASLLRRDVEGRRRELDSLLALQTRRVDGLSEEAEAAGHRAADADRRLTARTSARSGPRTGRGSATNDAPLAFFTALEAAMAPERSDAGGTDAAPSRLVVALDGFESVSSEEAGRVLSMASRLLNRRGIATIVAGDRDHLASGLAEADPALAAARLDRIIQVPYQVMAATPPESIGTLIRGFLAEGGVATPVVPAEIVDGSALDKPWRSQEGRVLGAVARFAGTTPRAAKRLVNLYRIARADPHMNGADGADLAVLAAGLALQLSGIPLPALGGTDRSSIAPFETEIQATLTAAAEAFGSTAFTPENGRRGWETARRYSSVA